MHQKMAAAVKETIEMAKTDWLEEYVKDMEEYKVDERAMIKQAAWPMIYGSAVHKQFECQQLQQEEEFPEVFKNDTAAHSGKWVESKKAWGRRYNFTASCGHEVAGGTVYYAVGPDTWTTKCHICYRRDILGHDMSEHEQKPTKTFEEAAYAQGWKSFPSCSDKRRDCGHVIPNAVIGWVKAWVGSICEPCLRKKLGYEEEEQYGIPHDRDFQMGCDKCSADYGNYVMDGVRCCVPCYRAETAKQASQQCQYATPQPVLKDGKRVESISVEKMNSYYWQGKFSVVSENADSHGGPNPAKQLKQEATYLRSQCTTLPSYPMCPVHGENVSVIAEVAEDTKLVTAMFVCERCRDG